MEPESKHHKKGTIINLILQAFNFLEEHYFYTPLYKVENDSTFIENLNVEYFHQMRRRKVRISYTKAKVYNEIKYTFSLSITRIPYSGVEDFFSLSNYLQSIGKDFSTSLINDFDEVQAEDILRKIATALKHYALRIVDGTEWFETFYPRKD